jgi:hypothetical protein
VAAAAIPSQDSPAPGGTVKPEAQA